MKEETQIDVVTERPVVSVVSGCMYAVMVVVVSGGMLFLNTLFCIAIYGLIPKVANEQVASGVGQLMFFSVPLILLVVEWHLVDRIQRLFRSSATN
ncbi:MAG: hypothetical protein AAF394_06970 [Planctomycetota bacterium]